MDVINIGIQSILTAKCPRCKADLCLNLKYTGTLEIDGETGECEAEYVECRACGCPGKLWLA